MRLGVWAIIDSTKAEVDWYEHAGRPTRQVRAADFGPASRDMQRHGEPSRWWVASISRCIARRGGIAKSARHGLGGVGEATASCTLQCIVFCTVRLQPDQPFESGNRVAPFQLPSGLRPKCVRRRRERTARFRPTVLHTVMSCGGSRIERQRQARTALTPTTASTTDF